MTRGYRNILTRGLLAALAVIFALGSECDPKRQEFFGLIDTSLISGKGDLFGEVLVDGQPRQGVTVTLRNSSGQVVATDVTDQFGEYGFLNADPGDYTVSIDPPSGATCSPSSKPATVVADQERFVDFSCSTPQPTTGTLTVAVTSGGTAQSGASVQISGPGGTQTAMTNASGIATFSNLTAGSYTVTTTLTGQSCGSASGTVVAGQTVNVPVTCTPSTGGVNGQVTVNGTGSSGVSVALLQSGTSVATTTTDGNGNYAFTGRAPGTYTVRITRPSGTACDGTTNNGTNDKPATVTAGQSTVVNFACSSGAGDFTVNLGTPPPAWNHDMPGVSSIECKVITTSPAQPGATYTVTTTGPSESPTPSGVVTPAPPGVLNASGSASVQVRINKTGTYTNMITVTSGGVIRSASITVTVTAAPNTCPVAASSARFKRGVTPLLPDGVTLFGLRPVSFRYRAPFGDPGVPQVGLLAEEVLQIFPGAVMLDVRARPDGIWYGGLNGLLIERVESRARQTLDAAIARAAALF